MVGTTGFEPAPFCSQSRRDTKLRYVPIELSCLLFFNTNSRLEIYINHTINWWIKLVKWRALQDSNL